MSKPKQRFKVQIINNPDHSQTHNYFDLEGNLIKSHTEQKPIHNQQNPIELPEVVVTTENPNKNKNTFTWNNINNSTAGTIAGFIPGIGDAMEIGQIGYDLSKGNYSNAALGAGLLLIPGNAGVLLKKVKRFINKETGDFINRYKDLNRLFQESDIQNIPINGTINNKDIYRNKAREYARSMSNKQVDDLYKQLLSSRYRFLRGTPDARPANTTSLNTNFTESIGLGGKRHATEDLPGDLRVLNTTSDPHYAVRFSTDKNLRPIETGSVSMIEVRFPIFNGSNRQLWIKDNPIPELVKDGTGKDGLFSDYMLDNLLIRKQPLYTRSNLNNYSFISPELNQIGRIIKRWDVNDPQYIQWLLKRNQDYMPELKDVITARW